VYGAGTLFLASEGRDIGPGHFGLLLEDGVEKFSCHYEAQVGRPGRSILDIRPLLWTLDGWPQAGDNLKDDTYQIRSLRTGTILEVSTNGPAAHLARYFSRDYQKWNLAPAGNGHYKILNAATGLSLDNTVSTAAFTGAENQLWKIDQFPDGTYRLAAITAKTALTVAAKESAGKNLSLQPFTGADDTQHWVITLP
jgi:arabinan endo-1,5-alpha-L-arabinosidase